MKAVGKRFEIICFLKKWSKKKPVNALVYRLCGGELGIRTLGSLWEHSISREIIKEKGFYTASKSDVKCRILMLF